MIARKVKTELLELLQEFPAVALLGPRQVGKTTLAKELAGSMDGGYIYLDLESPADRSRLYEPEAYFELHKGKLILLDEIQRLPELFAVLRGVIDRRRSEGYRTGQFLILGSASLNLLQQSSETLAGRIAYKDLSGFTSDEIKPDNSAEQDVLWLRGGFPDSFLSSSDNASLRWRMNFINTYLERDVPQLGPRIPAITLRRLWTMLAHHQGGQINIAQLGANLGITAPTAKRYLELLEDLLLIRTIRPWSGNIGKRLVKSPRVYVRDSGILHALLSIKTTEDLLAHPVVGASWEGFVIENILSCIPVGVTPWFYRTSAGAEIDLVLEIGPKNIYVIEIKRSASPVVSKGFYHGIEDIGAENRYIVYPGQETFPSANGVTVLPLIDMMTVITGLNNM
jgi:predicted AAA+ superfamily ATPase